MKKADVLSKLADEYEEHRKLFAESLYMEERRIQMVICDVYTRITKMVSNIDEL